MASAGWKPRADLRTVGRGSLQRCRVVERLAGRDDEQTARGDARPAIEEAQETVAGEAGALREVAVVRRPGDLPEQPPQGRSLAMCDEALLQM